VPLSSKQSPTSQADQLDGMVAQGVDLLFSVPIDPQGQAETYQRVSQPGVE
jgi:ribose transport system substrate-binding protein